MNALIGLVIILVLYLGITLIHVVLPGRWYQGYVTHEVTGAPLRYRLNGLLVLVISVSIWYGLGHLGIVPLDLLYLYRWWILMWAIILGLIYSIVMVVPHAPVTDSFAKDFYLGRIINPQVREGHIDHKMWLYLVGAIGLALNALSFMMHHVYLYGSDTNMGIYVCAGLILWFVIDYLTFERVHLYTYDIFAERVGFKLGWGCLAFYPFFYTIALWSTIVYCVFCRMDDGARCQYAEVLF